MLLCVYAPSCSGRTVVVAGMEEDREEGRFPKASHQQQN